MKFLAQGTPWPRAYFAYPTFQSKRASTDFPDQQRTRVPATSFDPNKGRKRKRKKNKKGEEEERERREMGKGGGFEKRNLIIGNLLIVPGVRRVFAHLNYIAYDEQCKFCRLTCRVLFFIFFPSSSPLIFTIISIFISI